MQNFSSIFIPNNTFLESILRLYQQYRTHFYTKKATTIWAETNFPTKNTDFRSVSSMLCLLRLLKRHVYPHSQRGREEKL